MSDWIFAYLLYVGELLLLTLGTFVVCGLAVQLCAVCFRRLIGRGAETVFDVTAVLGTRIHELGHAAMCLLFGHRIERMKLWSPPAKNGMYGYVEHSYNRKNPWAQLGNLFIGMGPLFSGLGVVILMLRLCFPTPWSSYLSFSQEIVEQGTGANELIVGAFRLFTGLFEAFQVNWLRALIGLCVILPVSLHVTLSWQDLKNSVGAFPLYLLMLAVFAAVTSVFGVQGIILGWLRLANLRLWSLFQTVLLFSAAWICVGLLARLLRSIVRAF